MTFFTYLTQNMSDIFNLLSDLSSVSVSKKEPLKDRIIQIISFLIFAACVIGLVLGDINWEAMKEKRKLIEIIIIAIVTTIIISVILYKCRILRDIMMVTFIFYIASVLMAASTVSLLIFSKTYLCLLMEIKA